MAADDDEDSFSSSPSLQEDRGLSLTLKRQLLSDIDEGGIANFKLEDHILKKPDLYGAYDTSPRRITEAEETTERC
jgi:hypothetical protein